MKRARFWFGTVALGVPVLLVALSLTPGLRLTHSGPVEGWVSFHGRPLACGSILFVPEDPKQTQWAHAWTDENGHYVIDSDWCRDGAHDMTRFRICVMPDSHASRRQAAPRPGEAGYRSAWYGLGDVAFPPPSVASGFPRRLCDPKTTGLEVQLGSQASRVDIAL
jgi:hypothetical protein